MGYYFQDWTNWWHGGGSDGTLSSRSGIIGDRGSDGILSSRICGVGSGWIMLLCSFSEYV